MEFEDWGNLEGVVKVGFLKDWEWFECGVRNLSMNFGIVIIENEIVHI